MFTFYKVRENLIKRPYKGKKMLEINLRGAKYQSYIFVIFYLCSIKANNQLSGIYI